MERVCPVSCIDMKKSFRRDECKDVHENCVVWSNDAECKTNESVNKYCPLSCGRCQNTSNDAATRKTTETTELCEDSHENCAGWAVRLLMLFFCFLYIDILDSRTDER